ncbi:MAG: adenylosuccinate lyase [Phycisphaerales bacterium]|nr:adenylosuccinate lyase [Phycisphaerales bacterium]
MDTYRSPLETRYASKAMQSLWSDRRRFGTWRRLWLALAKSQKTLGLPISDEQIAALEAHLDDIDFDAARAHEKRLRHDVMAHVHTLADVAPEAAPIIHLGATSQFVNCNTELLLLREAMDLIAAKTAAVIMSLGRFAERHKALPTLGFTHYQPAQPVTVGKRATLWAQDCWLGLEQLEHCRDTLRFRGVRGATGTQASFMALFDGDSEAVERLDELVTQEMGWPLDRRLPVSGQTYPRVVDAQILSALASIAAAVHKWATDVRLLSNLRELEEPFESTQIGSSAMAYKRNPMRCERACGMSRFVMNLVGNALQTAAVQWMERTLDDSANRRLVLPEAFLALDGVLDIMRNVADGLVVNEAVIEARLAAELPFMATEDMLMEAVRQGADRQEAHEVIREASMAAVAKVKAGGPNDLLERLAAHETFANIDLTDLLDANRYVGRAQDQVTAFLQEVVQPLESRYGPAATDAVELTV